MYTGAYDDGYRTCDCFWGTEPGSLVLRLQAYTSFSGLNVLDAGCGEGKNAKFLAKAGAQVDAIDISPSAIGNALKSAHDPSIHYSVTDIREFIFQPASYDIVLLYGVLHCLSDCHEAQDVMKKLKEATRRGGWHALCAFNDRSQDLTAHPGFAPLLMEHINICAFYSDWCIVFESDEDLIEEHPHNQITHAHSLTRILARKD